ncbi:MAG: BRO-N domain-containing protein [Sarcina sp.]
MKEELQVIKEQVVLDKNFKVYGDFENPLFLAKDVAEWIGHNKPNELINNIDDEEKLKAIVSHSGQNREMWFLTEDGLYEVLMQSRKPIAKAFKKEVKKILKDVRKTGAYISPKLETQKISVKEELELNSMMWDILKVNDNSKLLLGQRFFNEKGLSITALPKYTESKGQLLSGTELLKRNNTEMGIKAFNKLLLKEGIIEEKTRPSKSKGEKKFKSLVDMQWGENQVNTHSPKETQVLFYVDKFPELLKRIFE